MIILEIPVRLPGRNEQEKASRINRYAGAAMKKKYTSIVAMCCTGIPEIKGRAWFKFIWYEPNKRRDPDNISAGMKFIFDGLIAAGKMQNDGWANVAGFSHRFEVNKEPKVVIEITKK